MTVIKALQVFKILKREADDLGLELEFDNSKYSWAREMAFTVLDARIKNNGGDFGAVLYEDKSLAGIETFLKGYAANVGTRMPWCDACNSYHSPSNPSCFKKNPPRECNARGGA